jgi:hypothetical protein
MIATQQHNVFAMNDNKKKAEREREAKRSEGDGTFADAST